MNLLKKAVFALVLQLSSVAFSGSVKQVQPWLGVEVDTAITSGVSVKRVIPGAPAERAGFQTGDLITAVDAEKVKTRDELLAALRAKGVGTKVIVHFVRKAKDETKELKLELLPDMLDLAKAQLVGKPAPEFSLTNVRDHKTITNADFKNKVYILEFWATWCPACRAAAPFLVKWTAAHKDIPIVGISDEEPALVEAFVKKEGIAYLQTSDTSGKVQGTYGMSSIPAFILIDKTGKVNDLTIGIGEYLETLLNKADALAKSK